MACSTTSAADARSEHPHCFHSVIAAFSVLVIWVSAISVAQTESARTDPVLPSVSPPRINGPSIYGVHPNHPFLYRIPTVGTRPLRFSVIGLPPGLIVDATTGIISGRAPDRGTYTIHISANNSQGKAARVFRIVVGNTLALTPPMGWSSWYMAHTDVSDALIRAQADALLSTGLADHGYFYINIDDGWNRNSKSTEPALAGPARDDKGNLRTSANFPGMKGLTDYLHGKGLKAGIYTSLGPRTCAGYEGSYEQEQQDAGLFAMWGFDFLKYDLCSYDELLKGSHRPEDLRKPYALMGSILKALDRDMLFNLCEYGLGDVWEWGREVGGNYWRTTEDVGSGIDGSLWKSMDAYGFGEAGKEKWAGPGGWNDPDNVLLGEILCKNKIAPTPLTQDEQYTWMTLWSMLDAPLILGSDLTKLDAFTLALLTNDEVIAVNQDALGKQAIPLVVRKDGVEIWEEDLEDGSKAIALFNRGSSSAAARLERSGLGPGKWRIRDLWSHKNLGELQQTFESRVPTHGVILLRISRSDRYSAMRN
jgi:alpha-galactosidase